jgi:hypothetical protein
MKLLLVLAFLLNPAPAVTPAAPAAAAGGTDKPTVILVVGAEGEPEFGKEFTQSADHWADAARRANANLITIGRDPESPNLPDKQHLKQSLDAELTKPTAPLWLVLIGHGTFDGKEAKFNLRGPDVADAELADWLKPCRRPLAVIDCSSSSAPFLTKLSAPGRVIVTATQSGQEIQFAHFGTYLAAAVADPAADLDKDGQTSLLEAFLAASHNVDEFYKQAGRLATEHALLDDNGDARGTPAAWFQGTRATKAARDGAPLDGPRAHQWHLVLTADEQAMPLESRAKRDDLELKIEALRTKKTTLSESDYYAQLEDLLLQLARVYHPEAATSTTTKPANSDSALPPTPPAR